MNVRTPQRTGYKVIQRKLQALRMMPHVRVYSFGGGVQSTAVLVMQALGMLDKPFDVFVFSNVGDDSENPGTIEYIKKYAKPFANKHGIPLVVTHKTTFGKKETLYQFIYRTKRSVPIPAYMSTGAPGTRSCTNEFKIKAVDRWIRRQGCSHATVGLGISLDEFTRARKEHWQDRYSESSDKYGFLKRLYHPLIHQRVDRGNCRAIIQNAGLPVPPKSSCWFCPFQRPSEWIEMKREQPELFSRAIDLDIHINEKRNSLGRDRVYLHRYLTPLDIAVADQPLLPGFGPVATDAELCEGYCGV